MNFERDITLFYANKGYDWIRTKYDGSIVWNKIGDVVNRDMLISQVHIPNKLDKEMKVSNLKLYHSVESCLLVAIIKYMEMFNVECPNVESFVDSANIFRKDDRSFNYIEPSGFVVSAFDFDLPKFNDDVSYSHSPHFLFGDAGENRRYDIFVDNDDLVFVETEEEKKSLVDIKFEKEDSLYVLDALFLNAASGVGRTELDVLLSLLKYRSDYS